MLQKDSSSYLAKHGIEKELCRKKKCEVFMLTINVPYHQLNTLTRSSLHESIP